MFPRTSLGWPEPSPEADGVGVVPSIVVIWKCRVFLVETGKIGVNELYFSKFVRSVLEMCSSLHVGDSEK